MTKEELAKQKRVSFKVAKALKEAGYPQYFEGWEDYGYFMNGNNPQIYNHDENDCPMYYHLLCVAPTYLDVWLWLWREKEIKVSIDIACNTITKVKDDYWLADGNAGPEEAIEKAIEYLVDNKLLK